MKAFALAVVVACAIVNMMTTSVEVVEIAAAQQESSQVLIAAR